MTISLFTILLDSLFVMHQTLSCDFVFIPDNQCEIYLVLFRNTTDLRLDNGRLQCFYCPVKSIRLDAVSPVTTFSSRPTATDKRSKREETSTYSANSSASLSLIYLPLNWGIRHCCVLLSNEDVGEFVILIRGTAELPKSSLIPFPVTSPSASSPVQPNSEPGGVPSHRVASAIAAACKFVSPHVHMISL